MWQVRCGAGIACVLISMLSTDLHSADSGGKKLRLATQNMYEGTSFQELAAAQTPAEFAQAAITTYRTIQLTNPAERAAAIAREVSATSPHLIALQEASIVRTGAAGSATVVESDLLKSLLDELQRHGQHYIVVSVLQGLDASAPITPDFEVRLTTQDAVLARSDLPPSEFSWSNVQAQHYQATLSFPSPIGPVLFYRGYISLDAHIHGHAFRFVTTHLEVKPDVNAAQASELAAVERASPLPIVIAGDFNAVAGNRFDPSFASYRTFMTAGFGDAWAMAHPLDPGYTCCQAGDLRNVSTALTQRIDLIFVRGGFTVERIGRIGIDGSDRTLSGLWPSDHAGIVAVLAIPETQVPAKCAAE